MYLPSEGAGARPRHARRDDHRIRDRGDALHRVADRHPSDQPRLFRAAVAGTHRRGPVARPPDEPGAESGHFTGGFPETGKQARKSSLWGKEWARTSKSWGTQ